MLSDRNMSREINETEASNSVGDTNFDRYPVELSEYWCGMYIRGFTNDKASCTCSGSLKTRDGGQRNRRWLMVNCNNSPAEYK